MKRRGFLKQAATGAVAAATIASPAIAQALPRPREDAQTSAVLPLIPRSIVYPRIVVAQILLRSRG